VEIAGGVTGRKAIVLPICGEQKFRADLKREGYTCETLNLPKRIQRVGVLPTTKAILHHGRMLVGYQNRRRFTLDFGKLVSSKGNTTVT